MDVPSISSTENPKNCGCLFAIGGVQAEGLDWSGLRSTAGAALNVCLAEDS
jgi:hypothetical protein